MSHAPPVFSPAGTPLPDCTVGELVARHPNLSRVFQARNLGFCCQGKLTLRDACERHEIDLAEMVTALELELASLPTPAIDPSDWSLSRLAGHITTTYHTFLRRELPRIYAMAERVAQVHGGHTPSLIEIHKVFTDTGKRLAQHVLQEDEIFSALMDDSGGEIDGSALQKIQDTHTAAAAGMTRLRDLTQGFVPPTDACNTYRALFAGLADLESEMLAYFRLECRFLLPPLSARQPQP